MPLSFTWCRQPDSIYIFSPWEKIKVRLGQALGGGAHLKLFTNRNRRKSSSFTECDFLLWTLPRAKNCSPALNFCTSVPTGAALSSPARGIKNADTHLGIRIFWYTGRDSNPQPSEPESDALSIEPPVHLLNSLAIIAGFYCFVKRSL